MKITTRLLLFAAALSATSLIAAEQEPTLRCIVILDSRTATAPDLASLGGTIESRQDEELVVTIPRSRLGDLRASAMVKYVQAVTPPGESGPLIGDPVEPQPEVQAAARLVPHPLGNMPWDLGYYSYDGAGNITAIGTFTYRYDTTQRLVSSATDGYAETYAYDDYGNMTFRTGHSLPAVLPEKNRYSGSTYNQIGAVTAADGYTFAYDALGQTASKAYASVPTEYYVYTPSDERIGVQRGGWWFWSERDESGKVLRQLRSSATNLTTPALWLEDFVWRDGLLLGSQRVPELGGRRHYHLDHLGTPRLSTADNGQRISRHTYLPFGEELLPIAQETQAGFDREDPLKFTGHERDFAGGFGGEDGNAVDYMHARYYGPTAGHFLSVDPALNVERALLNPQTWNKYSYVDNSPMGSTDPTGRAPAEFTIAANALEEVWIGAEVGVAGTGLAILGAGAAGYGVGTAINNIAGVSNAVTKTIETVLDHTIYLAENNRQKQARVNGLIGIAAIHLGKVNSAGGPGKDPDFNHHKKEIKAFLEKALQVARRLPRKAQEEAVKRIFNIAEQVGLNLK
jgi:RHS repeat-associated protein